MKRIFAFLMVVMTISMVFGAIEQPEDFEIYFDTSDIEPSVRFGFTTSAVVPAVENDTLTSFELTDDGDNPFELVGKNAEDSLFIFWEILSSADFTIDISSSSMSIKSKPEAGNLGFTATTTSYTNSIAGTTNDIILNSENLYGTAVGQSKHVYIHQPSTGSIANSGTTAIQFVTDDAAKMHGIGKWTTNVTLKYMAN